MIRVSYAEVSIPSNPAAPMSKGEAERCLTGLRTHRGEFRRGLLAFHERQGYAALGFSSMADFVAEEFGHGESWTSRQLEAARIEREIEPDLPIGKSPTESSLRPLARLPEGKRLHAWRRAAQLRGGGMPRAADVEEAVERFETASRYARRVQELDGYVARWAAERERMFEELAGDRAEFEATHKAYVSLSRDEFEKALRATGAADEDVQQTVQFCERNSRTYLAFLAAWDAGERDIFILCNTFGAKWVVQPRRQHENSC